MQDNIKIHYFLQNV